MLLVATLRTILKVPPCWKSSKYDYQNINHPTTRPTTYIEKSNISNILTSNGRGPHIIKSGISQQNMGTDPKFTNNLNEDNLHWKKNCEGSCADYVAHNKSKQLKSQLLPCATIRLIIHENSWRHVSRTKSREMRNHNAEEHKFP